MNRIVVLLVLVFITVASFSAFSQEMITTNKVVHSSEIVWEKLNPARGDKSPKAGTIWGDRKGAVATGFLAKFVDGFSSPPHIHNVTYRAVVISGEIHNDDPKAENLWMKPGSFWTQPEGKAHITSAKGEECIAYVEIDNGPYLVRPTNQAYDKGEHPINIESSNVVWLNSDQTNWIKDNSTAAISFLWESKTDETLKGMFVCLPSGFQGKITSNGEVLHAILIKGKVEYSYPTNQQPQTLDSGSYFSSSKKAIHILHNHSQDSVVIYIRTNGNLVVEE